MTRGIRPGGHPYVVGDDVAVGSDGRQYRLCAECGASRRAAPHQPVDPRTLRHEPVRVLPEPGQSSSVHEHAQLREPREIAMLRLAADAVLDLPDIGWTLRQRVVAVRQATDLPPDVAPRPVRPTGTAATRTTRPSQRGDARWVRKAISGQMWDIAEAALDQGFTASRTGNGHVRFHRGIMAFSLSTTVREGAAHSLGNARAAARRAGVVL